MLSKNKDAVGKMFKGAEAKNVLSDEKAEVVALGKKKA